MDHSENARIVANRGAAGARRGGGWGGVFPPPLLRVEARGASHAASKVIARALQRGEASYNVLCIMIIESEHEPKTSFCTYIYVSK